MDEDFAEFLKEFVPMPNAASFPENSLRKNIGRVPNQLLDYWRRTGLCGFNSGALWFTDPDEYAELMEVLLDVSRPEKSLHFLVKNPVTSLH